MSQSAHLYIASNMCGCFATKPLIAVAEILSASKPKVGVMADYRFSAKVISRSKGQSSVASAAYRSAEKLTDERTGEVHDFGRKQGVIHCEVVSPDNTPSWMKDRAELWNAVEKIERRKDAQLSREIQLSLPHELNDEQRKELVRGFVSDQFVSDGMIADIAIHRPSAQGDERNHHAHIMLTTRVLTDDGFGKKAREWNQKDRIEQWREQWAVHQNRALEKHGHDSRVDHRSYADQGVDREPQQHMGTAATEMKRSGRESRIEGENEAIKRRNAERARREAEQALNQAKIVQISIAQRNKKHEDTSDFSRNKELLKRFDSDQKKAQIRLERKIEQRYGKVKCEQESELFLVAERLKSTGFRKFGKDIFGITKADKQRVEILKNRLGEISKQEGRVREKFSTQQQIQRRKYEVQLGLKVSEGDSHQKNAVASAENIRRSKRSVTNAFTSEGNRNVRSSDQLARAWDMKNSSSNDNKSNGEKNWRRSQDFEREP